MRKCRLAVIQMDSGENYRRNVDNIEQYIIRAAEEKADIIIFPETMDYYARDLSVHARCVPGPFTEWMSGMAAEYGIYIYCGSITEKTFSGPVNQPDSRKKKGKAMEEEEREPWLRNTGLLFDPRGEMIGQYSKLHMFDIEVENGPSVRESDQIEPGDRIVVCNTEFGKIGMSICYDIRFPELYRIMALKGAEILMIPANFTDHTGKSHWETLLRARAIENGCYVVAANQVGDKAGIMAHGHSMVIDPWGAILAEAGYEEQMLLCDIDVDRVQEVRAQIPSLRNRRGDVYLLAEKRPERED